MTYRGVLCRVIILLVTMGPEVRGAFERLPEGGRAAGMGGAAVAVAQDPWTLLVNPSLAAVFSERTFSAAYNPGWLGIPELTRSAFVYLEPTQLGSFAASGTWFGFSLYRETRISLTYARAVDSRFSCGVALDVYHLRIDRYGAAWALGFDVGCSYAATPEVSFGAAATNINAPRIGACRERLPQEFSVGVAYTPLQEMTLGLDLVREIRFPPEVRAGVSYVILDRLAVRAGASDGPETYSAGIGVFFSGVRFDYGLISHPDLGCSHHLSLTLTPGSL